MQRSRKIRLMMGTKLIKGTVNDTDDKMYKQEHYFL